MFLYLFDMLEFDNIGKVCASKEIDLAHARSNYLYLISKYNQVLLKENKAEVPEFFKNELNDVLFDIENNGNFDKAKKLVISNCVPKVQLLAKMSKNDKELIEKLNDVVAVKDKDFAQKFAKASNKLQLEYIITLIAGQVFDKAHMLKMQDLSETKNKSNLFKEMIKYNSLVETSDKVKNGELSVEQFKQIG